MNPIKYIFCFENKSLPFDLFISICDIQISQKVLYSLNRLPLAKIGLIVSLSVSSISSKCMIIQIRTSERKTDF